MLLFLIACCILIMLLIGKAIIMVKRQFVDNFLNELKSCMNEASEKSELPLSDVKKHLKTTIETVKEHAKKIKGRISILPIYPIQEKNQLSAGSCSPFLSIITYSPIWIVKVITEGKTWENAFLQTIGHEIGHFYDIKRGLAFYFLKKNNKKFYYWMREICCDYYGVAFVKKFYPPISREEILAAVTEKSKIYVSQNNNQKGIGHPSWDVRLKVLYEHTLIDQEVIKYIAKESNCNDEKYINNVVKKLLSKKRNFSLFASDVI